MQPMRRRNGENRDLLFEPADYPLIQREVTDPKLLRPKQSLAEDRNTVVSEPLELSF